MLKSQIRGHLCQFLQVLSEENVRKGVKGKFNTSHKEREKDAQESRRFQEHLNLINCIFGDKTFRFLMIRRIGLQKEHKSMARRKASVVHNL